MRKFQPGFMIKVMLLETAFLRRSVTSITLYDLFYYPLLLLCTCFFYVCMIWHGVVQDLILMLSFISILLFILYSFFEIVVYVQHFVQLEAVVKVLEKKKLTN